MRKLIKNKDCDIVTFMIIFIYCDNIYIFIISINQSKRIIKMLHCLMVLIKGLCCAVAVNEKIKSSENSGICLPIKCALEIKDCYNECTAEVTPTNDDVEMTGAPAAHSMS